MELLQVIAFHNGRLNPETQRGCFVDRISDFEIEYSDEIISLGF